MPTQPTSVAAREQTVVLQDKDNGCCPAIVWVFCFYRQTVALGALDLRFRAASRTAVGAVKRKTESERPPIF
jgi:hypothetical protein